MRSIFSCVKGIFSGIGIEAKIFYFICLVISGRFCVRLFQLLGDLEFHHFQSFYLWQSLVIVLLTHLFLVFLAFFYSKSYRVLSPLIIYIGLLFSFYFLSLLNVTTLKIEDTLFVRLNLIIFSIPVGYQIIKQKGLFNRALFKDYKFSILDLLIVIWLFHSLALFLQYNFNLGRMPYGDEESFWYASAKFMVQEDIFQSHLASYSGGGLHAFGIPFIAALPAKIFCLPSLGSPFFMPIAVIITLFLFLNSLKPKKYCFIFFLTALFVIFNNRSWPGQLCYQLIYGEGLSMIFFLVITYELRRLSTEQRIKTIEILLMSFCIGLLSLSKSPLGYLIFAFLIVLLLDFYRARQIQVKNKTAIIMGSIILSVLPFALWKWFAISNHINHNPLFSVLRGLIEQAATKSIFSFHLMNTKILQDIMLYINQNTNNALYYVFFSGILIFMTFRKRQFLHIMPIVFLISFVFLYYGFIYQGTDHGSALRYLMPQALALLYLGGVGFEQLIKIIHQPLC